MAVTSQGPSWGLNVSSELVLHEWIVAMLVSLILISINFISAQVIWVGSTICIQNFHISQKHVTNNCRFFTAPKGTSAVLWSFVLAPSPSMFVSSGAQTKDPGLLSPVPDRQSYHHPIWLSHYIGILDLIKRLLCRVKLLVLYPSVICSCDIVKPIPFSRGDYFRCYLPTVEPTQKETPWHDRKCLLLSLSHLWVCVLYCWI